MDQLERLEVSVRLKGMELRITEALYDQIDKLKNDAEIAVKKAVANYDFDVMVGGMVTEWLDAKVEEITKNLAESNTKEIEFELMKRIKESMKRSLNKEDM